jgi:hypothetical protein
MNFWKNDIDGGQPVVFDDFRFMDAAVRDAFTKIVIGLNNGGLNCIVQGCEFLGQVGTNDQFSAGLLLIDGELVVLDAQNALTTDLCDSQTLSVTETAEPAGNKTFEDAGVHDTYIKRRAIITGEYAPLSGNPILRASGTFSFNRLSNVILGDLIEFARDWQFRPLAAITVTTADTTFFGAGGGEYRKKIGKTCRINFDGDFLIASGSPSSLTWNAPAGLVSYGATTRLIGVGQATGGVDGAVGVWITNDNKFFVRMIDGSDFPSGPPVRVRFNTGDFPVNS